MACLWSGQYENMLRVRERLKVVLPLTLFIIAFLLYMNTKSMVQTGIVLLSVPFSLIGAVWLLWAMGFNVSIAVWVGMIALMGLDAETGVLLLLFMELAYKKAMQEKRLNTFDDLKEAIIQGSVRRLRPKMMTVMAAFAGLLADHVVHRCRGGCDEAHCGTHGRRAGDVILAGAFSVSGHLLHMEGRF